MEKKTQMETSQKKYEVVLLPCTFKKFGVAVMFFALIPGIAIKAIKIEMLQSEKELLKLLTINVFILGLFLVALARDKVENEMTTSLRLKSLALAFIWAVTYVLCKPLIDFLVKDPIADFKAQELVLSMLLVYVGLYFLQKKASK